MIKLTNLVKEETETYEPFMYSPVGFSCKVCKFLVKNKDEGAWACTNEDYIKWAGTYLLKDEQGNLIEDPSKWCSNWFKPRTK